MLRLVDHWVWDFWLVDDGSQFHMFFLKAPRDLGDPDRRHWKVRIGHATSTDLTEWMERRDALAPSVKPAFDDMGTWTGCVVQHDDGTWFMFYTGAGSREGGLKQRIGIATSVDLDTWAKHPSSPVLESDQRWYEQLPNVQWHDEAWRDPWVVRDPDGDGWHMLITARACGGQGDERGVIGHAFSHDLVRWDVGSPLSQPGSGFGHMEVPQVETVNGQPVLLFSCPSSYLSEERRRRGERGGIWAVAADSLLGPYDVAQATLVADESLYSGRLIRDRNGQWMMLAFRNFDADSRFIGEICDPYPVSWVNDHRRLTLTDKELSAPGKRHGGAGRSEPRVESETTAPPLIGR